jgi:hypothetical protein
MEEFHALSGLDCYYGLDCEWTRNSDATSLLQLSFAGFPVLVINLYKMNQKIPHQLKALLEMEKFIVCGRQIGGDLSRLESLGICVPHRVELKLLAETHMPGKRYGLDDLAQRYLKVNIDGKEFGQNANYEVDELPVRLLEYAAKDSFVSRLLAKKLMQLTGGSKAQQVIVDPTDESIIETGSIVELVSYGQVKATGFVGYVGNCNGHSECRKWGDALIGAGKALIQIDSTIIVPGYKPTFWYTDKQNPDKDWPPDTTLGSLLVSKGPGFILAVKLSSLRVIIQSQDSTPGSQTPTGEVNVPNLKPVVDCQCPALDDDKSTVGSIKDNKPGPGMSNESAPIVDSELMNEIEKASLATAVEDLTDLIRCCFKNHIFHEYDNLPLKQKCPIMPTVYQLLISATWIKNREEDENFT